MIDEHQRLKDGIVRVLKAHVGQENAITTGNLTRWLFHHGHNNQIGAWDDKDGLSHYDTRLVRELIRELRREGHLICSRSGIGLFFPATREEAEQYIEAEYTDRARDLLATAKQQKLAVDRMFPPQPQLELFREAE